MSSDLSCETPRIRGFRWCLIGGRLQYNETLNQAVAREIIEALGDKVIHKLVGGIESVKVVQYMPEIGIGEYFDPRQHAIGLTYAAEIWVTLRHKVRHWTSSGFPSNF